MKSLTEKDWGKGYLFTFLICCLGAFAIYLPFLFIDKGLFQYCGDFNTQQIPFYTYMNGFGKPTSEAPRSTPIRSICSVRPFSGSVCFCRKHGRRLP